MTPRNIIGWSVFGSQKGQGMKPFLLQYHVLAVRHLALRQILLPSAMVVFVTCQLIGLWESGGTRARIRAVRESRCDWGG